MVKSAAEWTACNAQVDMGIYWTHMSSGPFSHIVTFIIGKNFIFVDFVAA